MKRTVTAEDVDGDILTMEQNANSIGLRVNMHLEFEHGTYTYKGLQYLMEMMELDASIKRHITENEGD